MPLYEEPCPPSFGCECASCIATFKREIREELGLGPDARIEYLGIARPRDPDIAVIHPDKDVIDKPR